MPGLVPRVHALCAMARTWMAGTRLGHDAVAHPIKKRASRPPSSNSFDPTRRPGGARLHPGKEQAPLLLLRLLGLLRLLLRRLLRFLSHRILLRVNGETRHEGCSAEGQPRNILDDKLSRFAALCPALSHPCHRVIHSSDAFSGDFGSRIRIAASRRPSPPTSLTIRQPPGAVHESKTKGAFWQIAVRLR